MVTVADAGVPIVADEEEIFDRSKLNVLPAFADPVLIM